MARPTYVGGFSGVGTGASYTVSLNGTLTGGSDASPQPGDLILVCTAFGHTASVAPTCSGNTSGDYQAVHAALYSGDTWDTNMRTFYQFAGSTPDITLTLGRNNNTTYGGATAVQVWRGVDPTTPIDVAANTTAANNQSASRPDAPAHTPTTTDAVVIACGAGCQTTAGAAFTIPSGMANGVSAKGDGSTADVGTFMSSFDWTSSAYNPAVVTGGTTSTSGSWAAATFSLRPAPSAITGDLTSTETGSDTFASTGGVLVEGTAAATEAGDDTFAASGTVADAAIVGTLAATESGADTAAAGGAVPVEGTLAVAEVGDDTFAAGGGVIVAGTLAVAESGADTAAAGGTVLVEGALAASEAGGDTFAADGQLTDPAITGTLAATESGADTAAADGTVTVAGALSASETGTDALASNGAVVVSGGLAAAEAGSDTLAATGEVAYVGTLAATESGADTFTASGTALIQAPAGYPQIESVALSSDYVTNAVTVNLPAGVQAGDMLLVVLGNGGDRGHTWPAGWQELDDRLNGTIMSAAVGYRIADGSEAATIDISASGSVFVEVVAIRISNAGNYAPVFSNAVINAVADTSPNPGNVSATWGAAKNLFISAVGGRTGASGVALTGVPAGYSLAGQSIGTVFAHGLAALAYKYDEVQADDPGAFTFNQTFRYVTWSLVVRPTGVAYGPIAATEADTDTFSALGGAAATGDLAAAEAGDDAFAASGGVPVEGGLAAAEAGDDTLGATGTLPVDGALAVAESGADTFAATGTSEMPAVQGDLAASEAADTFTSAGDVLVQGGLAASEAGADTFAATGGAFTPPVTGDLAATEAADTHEASGSVLVGGVLAATEAPDTVSITGSVPAVGTLAAVEAGADAFAAAAQLFVKGSLAVSESGADGVAVSGSVRVSGSLGTVEAADALAALGVVPVIGSLIAEDAGDAASLIGTVQVQGTLAVAEDLDSFQAQGGAPYEFSAPPHPLDGEVRTVLVADEGRTAVVADEGRTSTVAADPRLSLIDAETRVSVVAL